MKINTMQYFIVDALKSVKRNRTVSLAATITVMMTFFIFGTFALVGLNFNKVIEDVAEQIEIRVYLLDDIKLVDRREVEIILKEQEGVKEVIYESREDAFLNLEESLDENKGILEGYDLESNPLPASFIVILDDADYADPVAAQVESMRGVESIKNQQDLINTIEKVVDGVQIVGVGLFAILVGVSIFLIMNTIKLTVYSRRKEVGIMKFVGATDWFIRWPFVIEGMIIGLLGSMISIGILYFAYNTIFEWIVSSMLMTNLVSPTFVLTTLASGFAVGGIAVGAIGSIFALRKFLTV